MGALLHRPPFRRLVLPDRFVQRLSQLRVDSSLLIQRFVEIRSLLFQFQDETASAVQNVRLRRALVVTDARHLDSQNGELLCELKAPLAFENVVLCPLHAVLVDLHAASPASPALLRTSSFAMSGGNALQGRCGIRDAALGWGWRDPLDGARRGRGRTHGDWTASRRRGTVSGPRAVAVKVGDMFGHERRRRENVPRGKIIFGWRTASSGYGDNIDLILCNARHSLLRIRTQTCLNGKTHNIYMKHTTGYTQNTQAITERRP